jgi:hypothetical protein
MGSHVEFRLFAFKITISKYYFILQPSGISNIHLIIMGLELGSALVPIPPNNNVARARLSSSPNHK